MVYGTHMVVPTNLGTPMTQYRPQNTMILLMGKYAEFWENSHIDIKTKLVIAAGFDFQGIVRDVPLLFCQFSYFASLTTTMVIIHSTLIIIIITTLNPEPKTKNLKP